MSGKRELLLHSHQCTHTSVRPRWVPFCQSQRRDVEIDGLLARSFDVRAFPNTVMGPVRALLYLATSRGLCRCVTGTQTRGILRAAGPSLDERKRSNGASGRYQGEPRFAGNSYGFSSVADVLAALPPE